MYVDRKWAYLNILALVLNGIFWCLTVLKIIPALLIVVTVLFILAVLVVMSYEINRQAASAKHRPL